MSFRSATDAVWQYSFTRLYISSEPWRWHCVKTALCLETRLVKLWERWCTCELLLEVWLYCASDTMAHGTTQWLGYSVLTRPAQLHLSAHAHVQTMTEWNGVALCQSDWGGTSQLSHCHTLHTIAHDKAHETRVSGIHYQISNNQRQLSIPDNQLTLQIKETCTDILRPLKGTLILHC